MDEHASDPPAPPIRTTFEDDAAVLDGLRRNDGGALAALYDRYGRLAFGVAYRIMGDASESEDVVQESFLAFWRQAERVDPARSARSYLLTIVHHRAVDALRRRAGRPQRTLETLEAMPGALPDPAELASMSEERDRVRAALGELPDEQRRAVELTYFGGLTIAEMASEERIPLGTAKSRLRLALERMRKSLALQVPR
jgi:RNA polymerase sigma-70 factor (ECF subfamily)